MIQGLVSGPLEILPDRIRAEDADSLRSDVIYSLMEGTPSNFRAFFEIDGDTGVVRQIEPVEAEVEEFNITVRVRYQ